MAVQDEHAITVSFPEDSVKLKENVIKHKEPILQSLLPSQLWILVKKFGLAEEFVTINRKKQATRLYGEVLKRGAYEDFLCSLEESTDHMGHSYIISLLKDAQFAPEKEIKESEIILKRINDHIDIILREVCVKTLEPLLIEEKLVTDDELDELRITDKTPKQKVKILLVSLKTKGPKAHFIFLHKCLARADPFHYKLFTLLATNSKKRKLCDPELAKDRKKKNIYFVQPPEGITTERYIKTISQIRHCYQSENRDSWKVAEEIIAKELCSQDNPLEVNIAIILESCTPLITDNRLEEVLYKVEKAREMCKELCNKGCDHVQALEGRCEWVLARMHKFRGDYNKAEECINQAFVYITHCQPGEERLLVSFEQACILLIKCESSLKFGLLNTVKSSLCIAKKLAEEQDYGTNMVQRCKIRLAQVHLHYHSFDMDTNKNAIPNARQLLLEVKQQDMQPRLQCEYFHILAKIYRIEGKKDLASEHLKQALEINKKYALQLEAILV